MFVMVYVCNGILVIKLILVRYVCNGILVIKLILVSNKVMFVMVY